MLGLIHEFWLTLGVIGVLVLLVLLGIDLFGGVFVEMLGTLLLLEVGGRNVLLEGLGGLVDGAVTLGVIVRLHNNYSYDFIIYTYIQGVM